jgi:RNA polymerase sigma-70 factor (ECF subfamily)
MDRTSASLLEQLRQAPGQETWERFVKLYTPLLFFWARNLGMREADAADLVQEVFTITGAENARFSLRPAKGLPQMAPHDPDEQVAQFVAAGG